jgi:hypothetical protein
MLRIVRPVPFLALALSTVLAGCGQDAPPPSERTDRGSLGQQIGEGYLDALREAEAARGATEARAREHEALDALLRNPQPAK